MMTHHSRDVLRSAFLAVMIAAAPGMGQGLLTGVKVTPSDSTAGSGALYTIKFRTSLTGTGIPANGKLRITFPPSFKDSTVAAVINDSGLNGGYASIQNVNHVLTLTRDNTGTVLAAGDSAQIKLVIVYNSTVADTFRLFIETLTAANARIDSARSPVFRIVHGPLDHFAIANIITPPTAGANFNLLLSARDEYNNVVRAFGGTVAFTANQGTIIPATSAAFVQGGLSQAVRTNLAGPGRVITATAGTGQFGSSNAFSVNPNALFNFEVSNISSPQIAGAGFSATFTAKDSLGNSVTGFNGAVNISAAAGNVTPPTSGAFSNGVRTETLTLGLVSTNNRLTITHASSGKSGQSNLFNVTGGALDHFVISAIATQIAGQNFNVTVTAQDANNNNIPHTGTVTLSDNTGTLSASPLVFSGQISQTVNNANITKAQSSVVITATGSGKTSPSLPFTVTHGALDHFAVSNTSGGNIAAQIAGTAFPIRLVAQDAFNNTVASYNQNAAITDLTGLNVTSANFSSGVLASQNLTILQTRNDNQLTVTGGAPQKSGFSNLFNVNPGALNSFTIDPISDQATGEAFSITIRARDGQNNLKTDFTGTVTISDLTNTITPTSSSAFIGGVRTESVRITQARTANTISVSGGSPVRNGTSNAFNVQALSIDRFEISTIGNQTAGTPFSVTIVARDANNNIVSNFNGTVTVSDLSGSISPGTSNAFSAGQLTQNFTVTKSFTNNRLTVSGPGGSSQSNTFNVSHAGLNKFAIALVPDQIAGQSFPITITAQDVHDNTVTSFGGAVSIALNTGSILPTTSGAFSAGVKTVSVTIAAAGNNRVISVNDGASHTGASNSFNVSASGLDRFEFTTTIGTQEAGTNFSFTIAAKDASGNNVNFNGTVNFTDPTGTFTPASVPMNGATLVVPNANLTKKQDGVFVAASGGTKSGQSNQFRVNPAALHRVRVVEGSSGDDLQLTTKTLNADQTMPVHAAGYDVFDNYIADQNVNWLIAPVTANIGTFDPATNAASTIFAANTVGTGRIVANHLSAIDDSSGVITVNFGAGNRVKVLDGTSGPTGEVTTLNLTTGQTRDVHAASFDADGNYRQDEPVTWSVTGNIGSLSQNSGITTRFTATTAGTGVINADHATLIDDATGPITVSSGNLFRVRIVEGESGHGTPFTGRNLTTDGELRLHAAGYDASNNYLGDFTVTWLVRNGIGVVSPTISASTSFNPQVPGTGRIVANHDTALDDSTNLFTVAVGEPRSIKILTGLSGNGNEVKDVNLVIGDPPYEMHASSYDADNNRIGDVSVTWAMSPQLGTLNPASGSNTRFTATIAGSGVISANHNSLGSDATGTITVQSGTLSYVKIILGPTGPGNELGPLSRTTDQEVTVHAFGYDAQNNPLGDRAVEWSILGDNIGALSTTNGTSTTLTLTRPGAARIVANHASARDDSSGVITVSVGALARIKILAGTAGDQLEVEDRSFTADESFDMHAGGFDLDGNYKEDVVVDWQITGAPIGALSPANGKSTTFSANRAGVGQIRATHIQAGNDLTGSITVTPGQLSFIKIFENPGGQGSELPAKSITTDQELRLYAAGFDADNNYKGDQPVNWSSAGTLAPVVNATGATSIIFQPTRAPANGTIRATHATAGFDTTGALTIQQGQLHHVAVLTGATGPTSPQAAITMFPSNTITVHAGGFDAKNNYIADEVVNWTVDGNIGDLSAGNGILTVFTAVRAGNTGSIRASHPNPNVAGANSGTITVTSGAVASIILRTAAANGGGPFNAHNMNADQEVTIFAAGYDAGNNYLGEVNVTWSNTGTLAPAVNASGPSFVFAPTSAAANNSVNGTIVGTYAAGISDATGLITVTPGAPKGNIELIPNPPSLQANGTSTSNIVSAVIVDGDGNNVGANRHFDVSISPSNLGLIQGADSNPAPGRQIATNAQSQLNFIFQAGTIGGEATITVSSLLGGATGNARITLGNLSITQISAPPAVTAGQTGITVSMSVQNLSTTPVLNLSGGLTFTGTVNRAADYVVTPHNNNPTSIPGSSPATLNFNVSVLNNAALENIVIDGNVAGTVSGSPVSKTGANLTASWQVLRPAQLAIQTVTTSVDTVAVGQNNLSVTVRVANNAGLPNSSSARIDSVRLRFRQGAADRSGDYAVTPHGGNPTTISGNGEANFNFVVNVKLGAALGDIILDAEAYGRDANSGAAATDLNAATTDDWTVVPGNPFRIVSITPSQPTVTASMSREWTVKMQLQNFSDENVTLDLAPAKTKLRFTIGTEVTSTYNIVSPTQMDNNGGTVLRGNSTGVLTFRITQTGGKDGIATISGEVAGIGAAGLPVTDNTDDGGTGEVTVQKQGTLVISDLRLSQSTITRNQTAPWTITAVVTNSGQSTIRFLADSTIVRVGNNLNYAFNKPLFTGSDSVIAGGQTKSFVITVTNTGGQTGDLTVSVRFKGVDRNNPNSQVPSNQWNAQVTAQTEASLEIQQVRASQLRVTAGQTTPWQITLVVRNQGGSTVSVLVDTSTNVRFRIGNQIQSGYTAALAQASWLGTNSRNLPGNTTDSLRFNVTTTGVTPGVASILAKVAATELNNNASRTATHSAASVTVQTPPNVAYISGSLDPKVVNNNTQYAFKVRVRNSGGATVDLNPNTTRFVFNSGSISFSANLDQNKNRSIAPGDTTLTFVGATIPADMLKTRYTPTIELRGAHNGNDGFARNLSVDTNELQVTDPGQLQVLRMHSSQATVTQGMTKPWYIDMVVRNNGGFAVRLDSLDLQLLNAGNVTGDFQIQKPDKFLGSANNLLAAGVRDSVRFQIFRSGNKLGATSVRGVMYVVDQSNNARISAESSGNNGSFVVQAPAVLDIALTSPQTVTQNQVQTWYVDMLARNTGGSTVRVDFDSLQTRIDMSLNSGDYRVKYPTALVGGGNTIAGGATGTLRFEITRTGTQLGRNSITGKIRTIELNSDAPRLDDTQSGGSTFVDVQTAARLRYVSTILRPGSAPNLPRVNTGQTFEVQVIVENTGGEAADNVRVRLTRDGTSEINPNEKPVEGGIVAGGSTNSATFIVKASSTENPSESFTATITAGQGRNTGTTVLVDGGDNTETAIIQRPAGPQILAVLPSVPSVPAFYNRAWNIAVVLQDTGGAAIVFNTPQASDIRVTIDNLPQSGYTIEPPAALAKSGDLILPGGEIDTLIYRVTSTGSLGGEATLAATIGGKDQNNNQAFTRTKNGQITVQTRAAVQISTTRPIVNNLFQGSGVGLVNTNQAFAVEVVVENPTLEDVRDVVVQLESDGDARIDLVQKTISTVPQGENRSINFEVTAAENPTLNNNPETFVARILSATAAQSGGSAQIFDPSDSTAQIRTQLPAELALAVASEFGNLTTRQRFDITATVSNRTNAADIDGAGRLTLELPSGFTIIEPENAFERPFAAGQPVTWTLRAPDADAAQARLVVRMTTIPLDKNTLAPAAVTSLADTAEVSVVFTRLSISKSEIVAPPGAKDSTVSTAQDFKIESFVAFSEDLASRKITLKLPENAGYDFKAGSAPTIFDFTQTQELSWQILAPDAKVEWRSFIIEAQGVTENGTGRTETKYDTVLVQTVQRATLDFDVLIIKPGGDTSPTLAIDQEFKIQAKLANLGVAAAIDTAEVRLQVNETGVILLDSQSKRLYHEAGKYEGFVEWQAKAPSTPTPARNLTVQLINLLKDENTGLPAAWNLGNDESVIQISVSTDSAGTLFVGQPEIAEPAGAADGTLSTEQEFTVRAKVTGRNLRNLTAELNVPPGFGFVVERDKIQEFDSWDSEDIVAWRVNAPTDKRLAQPLHVEVRAFEKNSNQELRATSSDLVIDVVGRAGLRLNAAITGPSSVSSDNVASVGQLFEVTAAVQNIGEAEIDGAASVQLDLPTGYSTNNPRVQTTSTGEVKWQIAARNSASTSLEEIKLTLIQPYPNDRNTGRPASPVVAERALSIRTEEPSLTVTGVSNNEGVNSGPVISGQKEVPVLALELRSNGDENASDIVVKALQFYVVDGQGAELAPATAIGRVQVAELGEPGKIYGELTTISSSNPLALTFARNDTVRAGAASKIVVMIDLAENATASDFFLALRSGANVSAANADPPQLPVQVNLTGGSISSVASVLSSEKYEDSFYNFPNPFSPARDVATKFNYTLPQDSQVEFRIFTLLGELVYAKTYQANEPQGRAGARNTAASKGYIPWDGQNGNGQLVLNGVYVAVLKTSAGTVKTKVAVVK